jgi:NADPH:quinone reductase-like Zn-dependent oxidoreductase
MELRTSDVPDPGAGDVRIRQTAIGINFIDVYYRRGSFPMVPPGGVLGMEAAGFVDTVGQVAQQARRLFEALASGAVVADRPRVYSLANVRRADGDLESRAMAGSLVLVP